MKTDSDLIIETTNKVNGTKHYKIDSKIEIAGKKAIQEQYLFDDYVVNKTGGKTTFYSKDKDNLFIVDEEKSLLKALDISPQLKQINEYKQMLGEISLKSETEIGDFLGYKSKELVYVNATDSQINFELKVIISSINGIKDSAFQSFFQSTGGSNQLVDIKLKEDDFIVKQQTTVETGGTRQVQLVEATNIEIIENDVNKFSDFLSYHIER